MRLRRTLRLATRGSQLALVQAEHVAALLRRAHASVEVRLVTVTTDGDRHRDVPLAQLQAPEGVFTRGLEAALLAGRADFGVHSLKDLPTELDPALALAAFPRRGDPRDALVSRSPGGFQGLATAALVGTSSPRRAAQALALRPDLRITPIRGNVDTRLQKLRDGAVDALLLAAAGLERLGRLDEAAELLPVDRFVPAAGQGALAVQCRADDAPMRGLLAGIDDPDTRAAVTAERVFLRAVGGGCRVPLAVYGEARGGRLSLRAFLASSDGGETRTACLEGAAAEPERLGLALGERLLAMAGASFLGEVRGGR